LPELGPALVEEQNIVVEPARLELLGQAAHTEVVERPEFWFINVT
jgi:hypothetical protein